MSETYTDDTPEWCDQCSISRSECGHLFTDPDKGSDEPRAVSFADIAPEETHWILPDLLPSNELVFVVGEEGIGKGLWWSHLLARLTTGPNALDVLAIITEDDPRRTVRPRLDVAGADVKRVHLLPMDPDTLTGTPLLPNQERLVTQELKRTKSKVLLIDPWSSTLPHQLSVKDPQQARQVLDPLMRLARKMEITIIAVTHTNRTGNTTRDSVGLSSVIRQSTRLLIMALQDPNDDSVLWVGVEKNNLGEKPPAARYVKVRHGNTVRLESDDYCQNTLRIDELYAQFKANDDERRTDKWASVIAMSQEGRVTRKQIEALYAESPNPKNAATKAIARWIPERLERVGHGEYLVVLP